METQYPKNTDKLLQVIEDEWSALMKVVHKLTPDQMVTPDAGGWSPKDNLSHLAFWERFMLQHYIGKQSRSEAFGVNEDVLKGLDENGENAIVFQRNRFRSLEDVLRESLEVHEQMLSTLREVPFAQLLEPFADDLQKRSILALVIANTSEHYAEHRATIEKVLKS